MKEKLSQEQEFRNDAKVAFDIVCDIYALEMSSEWTDKEKYLVAVHYLVSDMRDQLLVNRRVSEATYQLFRDLVYPI